LLGAAGASVMSSPLSVGRNQLRSSPNNLDMVLSIERKRTWRRRVAASSGHIR